MYHQWEVVVEWLCHLLCHQWEVEESCNPLRWCKWEAVEGCNLLQ